MGDKIDDISALPKELSMWIHYNIRTPIAGFEHKKKGNGTCYSPEEQIQATREQVMLIALSYLRQGRTFEEITQRLQWFCPS